MSVKLKTTGHFDRLVIKNDNLVQELKNEKQTTKITNKKLGGIENDTLFIKQQKNEK